MSIPRPIGKARQARKVLLSFIPLVVMVLVASSLWAQRSDATAHVTRLGDNRAVAVEPAQGSTATLTPTLTATVSAIAYLPILRNYPTPTPTPTVTPVFPEAPRTILALPNSYAYLERSGDVTMVGEVFNNTSMVVDRAKVEGVLLNEEEEVIARASANTEIRAIGPGDKSCFIIHFRNTSDDPAYFYERVAFYGVEGGSYSTGAELFEGLSYRVGYTGGAPIYYMSTTVHNTSTITARSVTAVATVYRADGDVIGCGLTPLANELAPDRAVTESVTAAFAEGQTVANYRLQLDATR